METLIRRCVQRSLSLYRLTLFIQGSHKNSEDAGEKPHRAAFNQVSIVCLCKKNNFNPDLEISTCDPLKYKMDKHKRIA